MLMGRRGAFVLFTREETPTMPAARSNRRARTVSRNIPRSANRRRSRPLLEELERLRLLATYIVNTNADSATGEILPINVHTLRWAIEQVNTSSDLSNEIQFALPGPDLTIALIDDPLPEIVKQVSIRGETQTGFAGAPLVQVDGSAVSGDGFSFGAGSDGSALRSLVVSNFDGAGVRLTSDGNTVGGNYIGTDSDGLLPLANGDGIVVESANNSIGGGAFPGGGTSADVGNLISGNTGAGVKITGEDATGNQVYFNLIGLTILGDVALPNANGVVMQLGATSNQLYFNGIGGNTADGVALLGAETTGNSVLANYIGIGADLTTNVGNGSSGVNISGAVSNTIGASEVGNVIAYNTTAGVTLTNGASGNIIAANSIGIDPNTSTAQPNGIGVLIGDFGLAASDNTIGAGNVISGNTGDGVQINLGSSGNVVAGNLIGTTVDGQDDLGNGGYGVSIYGDNNLVGGTSSAARNIISGNGIDGVYIQGEILAAVNPGGASNTVAGNYIGLDIDGEDAIGNDGAGVDVNANASNNTIGPGNVIASNGLDGVQLLTHANSNAVVGNLIGTQADGTTPSGNGTLGFGHGVFIADDSFGNTVGGTTSGLGNTIANNAESGVNVGLFEEDVSAQNSILGNSIYDNTLLGIDLQGQGNNQQPAPTLLTVQNGGVGTAILGQITAAANTQYRIEFFNSPAGGDEGQTFLGFVLVTTNGSGVGGYLFNTATALDVGSAVTATATSSDGDTSEFSSAMAVSTEAQDVSGLVSVTRGAFVYNRTTKDFKQKVVVKNTSSQPILGPITLVVIGLPAVPAPPITLSNKTGDTVVYSPGSPYLTVSVPSDMLAPGQQVSLSLVFSTGGVIKPITYTTMVISGPGTV